jgi:hypothetical protein
MCPHTTIYVSSYYYMCPLTTISYHTCVLILLYPTYMCPRTTSPADYRSAGHTRSLTASSRPVPTTIYVSSYPYILLCMCPHTTISCSICVLMLHHRECVRLCLRFCISFFLLYFFFMCGRVEAHTYTEFDDELTHAPPVLGLWTDVAAGADVC